MECTKESRVGWTSSAQLILNFSSPLITFFGKLRLSNIYFKKRKKERPWEVPSSWRHRGGGFWLLAPPPSASSLPNPISPSCRHQPFLSGILHFAPQYLSPTYFAPQSFQSPWILDLTLYQFRHAIQDCLGKKKKKRSYRPESVCVACPIESASGDAKMGFLRIDIANLGTEHE